MKEMLGTLSVVILVAGIISMTGGRSLIIPASAMETPVDTDSVQGLVVEMDCEKEFIVIVKDDRFVRFRLDRVLCLDRKKMAGSQVRILYKRYKNGMLEVNEITRITDTGN